VPSSPPEARVRTDSRIAQLRPNARRETRRKASSAGRTTSSSSWRISCTGESGSA
jgi:hypothetical protein